MKRCSQYLKKRQHQHVYNIKRNNVLHSTLCLHDIEYSHNFDFEISIILHKCNPLVQKIDFGILVIVNSKTDIDNFHK